MSEYLNKYGFDETPVHDCHYHIDRHYKLSDSIKYLRMNQGYLGMDKIVLLCFTEDSMQVDPYENVRGLYFKEFLGDSIYTFAGLHSYLDERDTAEYYLSQIEFFYNAGFDGIKIMGEGKAACRKFFNHKLDDERFDKFFAFAEETGFPMLIHAGDVPNSEEMRRGCDTVHTEMLNVLEKYPKLQITFAHMMFLTDNIEKLTEIFEKYPNVSIDLALGGFMRDVSNNIEEWRAFFTKYSDRILFGTDNYNNFITNDDCFELIVRNEPVRKLLEYKDTFTARVYGVKTVFNPLLISKEAIDNIYRNNFVRLYGEKPRKVNYKLAYEYTVKLLECFKNDTLNVYARFELPDWIYPEEQENLYKGNSFAIETLEEIKAYYENKVSK